MEGEAIEFGSEALDAAGFDCLSIVIGSEGMLAVTTEVTVKLVPTPQLARCIMASFDDIRKAGDAVAAVIAAGIIPAGLEMMDKPMRKIMCTPATTSVQKPFCCAKAMAPRRR